MTFTADPTRPHTLLRALTCATVALLALTACTDSSAPATTSPSSTSATPEPSETNSADPSPTDPTLEPPAYPENIDKFTEENAIKFAEHYVDLFNYATASGDAKAITSNSLPTCEYCNSWSKLIDETYGNGGKFEEFQLSATEKPIVVEMNENRVVIKLFLRQSTYSFISSQGAELETIESSSFENAIAVTLENGNWLASQYGHLK